ncbi:MAG: hypothetical protein ACREV4_11090 [Gammaproteobacteria bacterium]
MTGQSRARLRLHLAQHAARLMAVDGVTSFSLARQKAAQQLGVKSPHRWPDNCELERALAGYQRLFQGSDQEAKVARMRQAALEAMRLLAAFQPRLVGSVVSGTATDSCAVCLHVFTDTAEELGLALSEYGICHRSADRRLRIDPKRSKSYPAHSFFAGEIPFEVIVFPLKGLRQAPLSPLDGRPMPRADIAALEKLLQRTGVHAANAAGAPSRF